MELITYADVTKMVDVVDLGSSELSHESSKLSICK
jgi:hypothetical protein